MGRPNTHTKDALGRSKAKQQLQPASAPTAALQKDIRKQKLRSKYTSHLGMVDKRPSAAKKNGSMEVGELLTSLQANVGGLDQPQTSMKRGDQKKLMIQQIMMQKLEKQRAHSETPLLPSAAVVATTASAPVAESRKPGHGTSRNARNQALLREGQAFASVHALPLAIGGTAPSNDASSSGFSGAAMDPFELVNGHLSNVLAMQVQSQPSSQSKSTYQSKKPNTTQHNASHGHKGKQTKRR
jgi:hypothetical protein